MTTESEFLEPIEEYFLTEASELLQTIEQTLFNLLEEKTTDKVHTLMRSAHTIKGSAANCELKTIETIAHHLEDVFQALYPDELDIDPELGSLLLEGYECLKNPLSATLSNLPYDEEQILDQTASVFAKLQTKLGDFFGREAPLPTSEELGFDIVGLIFADSAPQDLEQLSTAIASENLEEIRTVTHGKAEFFEELGISYELPGLVTIAQAVITAIEQNPDQILSIAQAALENFQQAVDVVLAGDRTQGGEISEQLRQWIENPHTTDSSTNLTSISDSEEESISVLETTSAEISFPTSSTEELLTVVNGFDTEEKLTVIQDSSTEELSPPSCTTEELLNMVNSDATETSSPSESEFKAWLKDSTKEIFSNTPTTEELLNMVDSDSAETSSPSELQSSTVEISASSSTTEELLTMVDSFEAETVPLSESESSDLLEDATAKISSISSTTEELLTVVDSFEAETAPLSESKSSDLLEDATTEELLTMGDSFEAETAPLPESESSDLPEDATTEISSFSSSTEALSIVHTPEASSAIDRILQSIFMGEWETTVSNSKNTTSDQTNKSHKTQKSLDSKIKSSEKLPSIRVTVKELDRLSHSIGELLISENQQNLQSDQIHRLTQNSFEQFIHCQKKLSQIRDWSDQNLLLSESKRRQKQKQTHLQKNTIISSSSTKSNQSSPMINGVSLTEFDFDVLEMDVYSDLHLLIQNLTEQMTQLGDQIEALEGLAQNFRFNLGKRKQLLSSAQEDLLQARMLPLATVLNRFPRILQQMVASHKKDAELKLIGAEVLIDKVIVEKLYDPLLHLIRNAYDHGLEPADIRLQQGKSEAGQITIRAYHQGNRTTIEISDDGQGLNWERIRAKAIDKELLTPTQAASASETELAELLFEPGFSTTEKVSQLSGRGIGLDVVRNQLQLLQGSISVNSVQGEGTKFILQFPINLTTARLLICESKGIVYGLLSEVIDQVLLPQPDQIQYQQSTIGQNYQTFLCWGEKSDQKLIPINPLTDLINYQYPTFFNAQNEALTIFPVKSRNSVKPLLMLQHEQQKLCLEVDQILVEQELVIKSFDNNITLPNYIQGYSILGNGSLTLVIDIAVLVRQIEEPSFKDHSSLRKLSSSLESVANGNQKPKTFPIKDQQIQTSNQNQSGSLGMSTKVLVVDDSVVQRKTLAQHITKAGYKVLQAANGQEALAQLNHDSDVQLVICDIEMPYMNGFEFLSHWRQDDRFSNIPVMMLTTRSGNKHRQLALALGAKVYFTKPCSNEELLETIAELLDKPQKLIAATPMET